MAFERLRVSLARSRPGRRLPALRLPARHGIAAPGLGAELECGAGGRSRRTRARVWTFFRNDSNAISPPRRWFSLGKSAGWSRRVWPGSKSGRAMRRPRRPPAWCPIWPPARPASVNSAIRRTGDSATRLRIAPRAARATPSSSISPTTARTPPCGPSGCARNASANTPTRRIAASTRSPTRARSAARAFGWKP